MQTYKQLVDTFKVKMLNDIENMFINQQVTIQFNTPFKVVMTSDDYGDIPTIDMCVVERLEDGMTIIGKDAFGDEWEQNIYQLTDLVEIAHMLDELTAGRYVILDEATMEPLF